MVYDYKHWLHKELVNGEYSLSFDNIPHGPSRPGAAHASLVSGLELAGPATLAHVNQQWLQAIKPVGGMDSLA